MDTLFRILIYLAAAAFVMAVIGYTIFAIVLAITYGGIVPWIVVPLLVSASIVGILTVISTVLDMP